MAYLDGLSYRPNGSQGLQETRAGVPQYGGTAQDFEEWKFRVMSKVTATNAVKQEEKAGKLAELASRVTDALTDDALKIAMDIGGEALAKKDGLAQLVKAMEEHVMQFKADEARDLFHAGTRRDGAMSRQTSESMQSYIARRRRWLQRLHVLDGDTQVSENILADYLLNCSGLTHEQKLMIRTVCGNRRKFEEIASALRQQHPTIQTREHKKTESQSSDSTWQKRRPFQRRPFAKKTAYNAEQDGEQDYDDDDTGDNYFCYTCAPDEEFESIEDQIEQDIVTAFMSVNLGHP